MKQLLLIAFFLPFLSFGQNPTFEWAISFAVDNSSQSPYLGLDPIIKSDADGNVYLLGEFNGTLDVDPGPGTLNFISIGNADPRPDLLFLKISPSGNLVWARHIGGISGIKGFDFDLTENGEAYIVGHFVGTIDFDPGPGEANKTSSGGQDMFILSLNPSGNFNWVKIIGGSGRDSARNIKIGKYRIYLFGLFSGTVDFDLGPSELNLSSDGPDDRVLFAYDFAGNLIYAKEFGHVGNFQNNSDFSSKNYFTLTSNDEVLVSGNCVAYRIDLYPGQGIYSNYCSYFSIFHLKLDSIGNFAWAPLIEGGANITQNHSLVGGKIAYTGHFSDVVDFDPNTSFFLLTPSPHPTIPHYSIDSYLSILDRERNFVSAIQFAGANILETSDIASDDLGNLYFAGTFEDLCDFNPGPKTTLVQADSTDVFVFQMSQNGDLRWVLSFGDSLDDRAKSIALGPNETIYTSGTFQATVNFDPGSSNYSLTADTTIAGLFITKHSNIISDLQPEKISSGRVYPNPTTGKIKIEIENVNDPVSIEILSKEGKTQGVFHYSPDQELQLEIPGPPGIYLLRIKVENSRSIQKKVIKY